MTKHTPGPWTWEKGERFDKSILHKCSVGEAEIAKAKGEKQWSIKQRHLAF